MVERAITNLDLSKASGTDCIPVVVLKTCESELSYILADIQTTLFRKSSDRQNFLSAKSDHPYLLKKVFPTAKHVKFDKYVQHSKTTQSL